MKKKKKRRNFDKMNKKTARSAMDRGRRYVTFLKIQFGKKNLINSTVFKNYNDDSNFSSFILKPCNKCILFIKILIEANETMTIATIYMMYIGQN